MPTIKSSTDLQNNYNEISSLCHSFQEPVFITKSGQEDLVMISIEMYEKLTGSLELYGLLREGLDDVAAGRTRPFNEAIDELISKNQEV